MEKEEYIRRFGVLASELSGYGDGDYPHRNDGDDANYARRWLVEQYGNPIEVNPGHLITLIRESEEALAEFDECGEHILYDINLQRIDTAVKARDWLKKMNQNWRQVLAELEKKLRATGGGKQLPGC